MRLPIHLQAEQMGLTPPVGCTAGLIRELGYDVPESVMDSELYIRDGSVVGVVSDFSTPTTGYLWQMPPGRFEFVLQPTPRFLFIPDWGAAVVYATPPTEEELKRAVVVPTNWFFAETLTQEFYCLTMDFLDDIRESESSVVPERKLVALRTPNG